MAFFFTRHSLLSDAGNQFVSLLHIQPIWGINRGYLEKEKYLSIAEKAWHALTSIVHEDGKVGYVQPIGADPKKVDINDTEVYGTGAFLMAATEYIKYLKH